MRATTRRKAVLNRYLFTQVGLDSGALTSLGTTLHNFAEPGRYQINVWQGERLAGSVHLKVDAACPATQANIDLATVNRQDTPCCGDAGTPLLVNPKGYAVFHVGSGPGGYAVTAGRVDQERPAKAFDSRELREGDMFAATILRPGIYEVENVRARTKARLTVAYPRVSKERYVPQQPLSIACAKEGFEPKAIEAQAAQSLVFHIKTPTRLKITLVKPDDGPGGGQPQPRPGWRRPDVQSAAPPVKRPVKVRAETPAQQAGGGAAQKVKNRGTAKAR
jgi:hypothetical protein